MEPIEWIILGACAVGMSYRAYKLGIKEGISTYVDFCKDAAKPHNGKILIMFHGNNIEFLDPMTHTKLVLDNIIDKVEENNKKDK